MDKENENCIDMFNVRRGKCLNNSCHGCVMYWKTGAGDPACLCCGCFPAKHEIIKDRSAETPIHFTPRQTETFELGLGSEESNKREEPIDVTNLEELVAVFNDNSRDCTSRSPPPPLVSRLPLLPLSPPLETSPPLLSTAWLRSTETRTSDRRQPAPATETSIGIDQSKNAAMDSFANSDLRQGSSSISKSPCNSHGFTLQSCIPVSWPGDLKRAIKSNGPLTISQRQEITRIITERTLQNGFTKDRFPDVAQKVLTQIPAMKSSVIDGIGPLVTAMKECLRHKLSYQNKKSRKRLACNKESSETVDDILRRMKEETQKPRPSVNVLKGCLEKVRPKRTAEAKLQSADQHIKRFPALEMPTLISWEFSEMMSIPEAKLQSRWTKSLPKLAQHFTVEVDTCPDKTAAAVVQAMCRKMGSSKSKRQREEDNTGGIFRIYDISTSTEDSIPKEGERPAMVAIGDPLQDGLSVVVYVDQRPIFCGPMGKAVYNLVAAYYVFQTEWPIQDKVPMILLSAIFCFEKMRSTINRFKSVMNVMEVLQVTDP